MSSISSLFTHCWWGSALILAATGLALNVRVSRRLAHHHPSAEQPGTH